jgi:hypothetical protein
MFSAYIAVVNGVQTAVFANVTISVRLQTSNAFYELADLRPSSSGNNDSRVLNPAESMDVVVRHQLGELGTHTMRVSVQYTDVRTNEVKTLRKFYRFNVLNALVIKSKVCKVLNEKLMIQFHVLNSTKSQVFLKEVFLKFTEFYR